MKIFYLGIFLYSFFTTFPALACDCAQYTRGESLALVDKAAAVIFEADVIGVSEGFANQKQWITLRVKKSRSPKIIDEIFNIRNQFGGCGVGPIEKGETLTNTFIFLKDDGFYLANSCESFLAEGVWEELLSKNVNTENILSSEQCANIGGYVVNTSKLAGNECPGKKHAEEINIGKVQGKSSSSICCAPRPHVTPANSSDHD